MISMRLAAIAASVIAASAHGLEGRVVDRDGRPVAGAKIEIPLAKRSVVSDREGRFAVPDDAVELHITAPGFSHRIIHLHELNGDAPVIALAATVIDQIDVVGVPIHASVIESAIPVSVLSGEALRNQTAATLGDTLERQPGVNTNFHGNVASTPVIRGLSGPRVLITQNSLDVSDVSRVGPDHAVASEAATAKQIEMLRGPATLFYGSGAIGGVVNVVDQRVPQDTETRAEFELSYDSVNEQNLASFNGKSGVANWGLYADGFWRDTEDYSVPVASEGDAHDNHGGDHKVANSAEQSSGFTLGATYLLDNGFVGVAAERLDREYGIPGHSHGGHDQDETPVEVYANLEQNRYQLLSELAIDGGLLREVHTRAAYTEYVHTEFESGRAGTVFENQTSELRVDLLQQEWHHWKGGVNLHYKRSDVAAQGEEAFTPPSVAETFAIALMEEKHVGDVLFQLGVRAERVTLTADDVLLPPLEVHGHDDAGDDHGHDHGAHSEAIRVFAVEQAFTPVSFSVGAVWDFTPGYNLGLSLSRAQRAPSASELLSFGPHIGTRSYEIGALFDLHEEDGEAHFELNAEPVGLETSSNIDLSFRKYEGDVGLVLNAFYNKVNDYYYQQATGLFAESGHDHGHDDHGDEHDGELPVYLFTHDDAEFYGVEAQAIWKINSNWETRAFTDYVYAELTNGEYLPRTPPMRFGADINFNLANFTAGISWLHYAEQSRVAALEAPTDGYDWLDAQVNYAVPMGGWDLSLFFKVENITDTEARVHTSFIKDVAPRPGRNFSVGLRGTF